MRFNYKGEPRHGKGWKDGGIPWIGERTLIMDGDGR